MATNYAHASYTEVVDMQTVDGKLSIVGIHTPIGKAPYLKLRGFFRQFKKYRYKGISNLTMVPASGLPIDPLGLGVVPGSTDQMDPRDTFNPILFKGCHGEHLHTVLDSLMDALEVVGTDGNPTKATSAPSGTALDPFNEEVSPSLVKQEKDLSIFEANYYKWLTDTSWRKFGIQSVVKIRNLHPLVWKMARNMPQLPSADGNIFNVNAGMHKLPLGNDSTKASSPLYFEGISADDNSDNPIGDTPSVRGVNPGYVQEFTNGCARLGWLPTTIHKQGSQDVGISALPKLFMGVLVLPPSYSTEQFMRCVIRHEFEFRDFSASDGGMDSYVVVPAVAGASGTVESGYVNWIDYQSSKGSTFDILNGKSDVVSDGVS